jgi:hypothetical protein
LSLQYVIKTNNFSCLGLIAVALSALAIIVITGCSFTETEPTPYDRENFTPLAGPPPFPIIFEGKFTVDGEAGPGHSTIYAEFIHGGSPISTTLVEGKYAQVILGPVSESDIEHGVISFYLGTRDGDHVKAEETWDWNTVDSPINQVLDLTFSRLPEG